MNLEAIPKSFWHTISTCLLILTVGLTVTAYRAQNFTVKYQGIEFATTKHKEIEQSLEDQLARAKKLGDIAAEKEQELAKQETIAAERLKELEEAYKVIEDLESRLKNTSGNKPEIALEVATLSKTLAKDKEKAAELESSRAHLDKLKQESNQQRQAYQFHQGNIQQQQQMQQQIQQQLSIGE